MQTQISTTSVKFVKYFRTDRIRHATLGGQRTFCNMNLAKWSDGSPLSPFPARSATCLLCAELLAQPDPTAATNAYRAAEIARMAR